MAFQGRRDWAGEATIRRPWKAIVRSGQNVIQISGCAIERFDLDTEVLKHGGKEIVQWSLFAVVALDRVVVALMLQVAASQNDGQVAVGVSGCIAESAAEEHHRVIEERAAVCVDRLQFSDESG